MAKKNDDFDLKNLPIEAQDPEIRPEDFVVSGENKVIHEQKLQTRPTTFLKDSIHRFAKNKSSVVAAIILGLLLVLSIVIPIADRSDVANAHPEAVYLEPKLFNAGTGFWDGTKDYKNIAVDISADPAGDDKEANWWPNPSRFEKNAVTKKVFTPESYTNQISAYGKEGYINFAARLYFRKPAPAHMDPGRAARRHACQPDAAVYPLQQCVQSRAGPPDYGKRV